MSGWVGARLTVLLFACLYVLMPAHTHISTHTQAHTNPPTHTRTHPCHLSADPVVFDAGKNSLAMQACDPALNVQQFAPDLAINTQVQQTSFGLSGLICSVHSCSKSLESSAKTFATMEEPYIEFTGQPPETSNGDAGSRYLVAKF